MNPGSEKPSSISKLLDANMVEKIQTALELATPHRSSLYQRNTRCAHTKRTDDHGGAGP